ncbi:hypothetical protein A3736_14455 [Erythrobacter sp. HI0063]|nr:hypothetical protein A3736_14455 [Erythrobacter sp. HI0063]
MRSFRVEIGESVCFEPASAGSSSALILPSVGHLRGARVRLRSAGRGPFPAKRVDVFAELGPERVRKGDRPPAAPSGARISRAGWRAEN